MNSLRNLRPLPVDLQPFGLKAICDKMWPKLDRKAKVMLWESALAMTQRWEPFKKNILEDDLQEFIKI